MTISIIIPAKEFNHFLRTCLHHCLKLDFPDYEVLVLTDQAFLFEHPRVRVIETGPSRPSEKRDQGAACAQGEILAFLDDDAYPSQNWLSCAMKDFQDPEIAAVGGPGVTPPFGSIESQAGGLVYESRAVSGSFRYRYRKEAQRFVDDFPSCNLLVRKSVFDQLGGFQTEFWPGEDTLLCLGITKKLGKKILYDPDVLVFHHRRPLFVPHLEQIARYAMHRGYFVKRFPETSLRWQYFMPSALLTWFCLGLFASAFHLLFLSAYLFVNICYTAFIFNQAYQPEDRKLTFLVFSGIFLTHIYYGLYFMLGLLHQDFSQREKK